MKKYQVKTYPYSELSSDAKNQALLNIEPHLCDLSRGWSEKARMDLENVLNSVNFKMMNYDYFLKDDPEEVKGASFVGIGKISRLDKEKIGNPKAKEMAGVYNEVMKSVDAVFGSEYELKARVNQNKGLYSNSGCMGVDVELILNDNVVEPELRTENLALRHIEERLTLLYQELADGFYDSLVASHNDKFGQENLVKSLESGELKDYEFLEDGSTFRAIPFMSEVK